MRKIVVSEGIALDGIFDAETMGQWSAPFYSVGDIGSLIKSGFVLHSDGSKDDFATRFSGYSIIQARNIHAVKSLVKDHPFLSPGNAEIFELTR